MDKGEGKADADRFAVFSDGHEEPVAPHFGGSGGKGIADSRLSQSVGTGMSVRLPCPFSAGGRSKGGRRGRRR